MLMYGQCDSDVYQQGKGAYWQRCERVQDMFLSLWRLLWGERETDLQFIILLMQSKVILFFFLAFEMHWGVN